MFPVSSPDFQVLNHPLLLGLAPYNTNISAMKHSKASGLQQWLSMESLYLLKARCNLCQACNYGLA